jgi:cytochrome c1
MAAAATPNQLAYDVNWYDLDLTFNPPGQQVSGTVRVRAKVLSGPLSTLDLDLNASMGVTAVTSAGVPATFTRPGDLLSVSLDRAYATGELVDVRVTYAGTPVQGSFGYTLANGRQLIWSLSEPYGARTWWPCKDLPADKADSVTIRYTVPSGLITASNGTQLSATDNGTQAVTRWRESHPISTYLVSIASYPYTHTLDWYRPSPTDSMRIDFFNYPETAGGVAAVQGKVKTMLGAYAARFGPYPFQDEKYGHAQFQFSGGMEHQTCTSLGAFAEFIVAHELGHQWWGDLVTCRDFHHVWLNEGFATYMEAIWAESQGGPAAYHADLDLNKYYGPGSVYVPNDQDESRIFDSNLSYDKASWVLHMLRHVLGDATFFNAMLQYRATNAYGTATTEVFRAACEAASGRNLTQFFQQWVYGERYPVYRATWTSHAAGGGYDVALTLEQRQSWQRFTMPVDVRVTTNAGPRDFVVPDSLASQSFTLHVDAQPVALDLDADDWILKQVDRPVVQPPFDRGVLVVNGVDWATYGAEITSAYTDRAFSGNYAIDFWDHFSAPAGGYPAVLPPPLGHGPVPPDVLGHYRNVVWVGNAFNGDADSWVQTPIRSYLDAGGNVLLLCKDAQVFLDDGLLAYLGITFTNLGATINDYVATRQGFVNLTRTGTQSAVAAFDTVRSQPDTQLLYKTTTGFTPQRGVGFVRLRASGAGLRAAGGRFALLSGRPYRWTHTNLNATTTKILSQYFLEPLNGLDVPGAGSGATGLLASAARPDPATGPTSVRLDLPHAARVRLEVVDVAGRIVRVVDAGVLAPGAHDLTWDGRDADGRATAAGLYWLHVRAGADQAFRRVVRLE